MKTAIGCSVILIGFVALCAAERHKVKIVDRRESDSTYSYVVPAQVQSTSKTGVNCTAYSNSAECQATTNTNTTATPAQSGSYSVQGATFSLLLDDGRIAVVNCSSKVNLTQWSMNARRSCRMPIVDAIEVEFSGANAKLIWPVSIDGRKTESETYKIIGILEKPQ
jgi:hypothetical protein